ncbi:hypothetical protein Tco_0518074 [Tanacetum coccineum]
MYNIHKKNNDKSNYNEGYVEQSKFDDRSNGKGNDVQMEDKENIVNEGFAGNLNGEQFPLISSHVNTPIMNELHDNSNKVDSVESDCLNAYVNQDVKCVDNNANSINDSIDTVMVNDSEEWKNRKLVDIGNALKLDNKLFVIPTETGEGRIGFARVLVEIDAEKEINDKIEIVYKVFKHEVQRCIIKHKNHKETIKEKTNENVFKMVNNKKMRNEGIDNSRKTHEQTRNYGGQKNRGNNIRENIKSQATSRFEYRRRMNEWKSDKNMGGKGIEKDVNKREKLKATSW